MFLFCAQNKRAVRPASPPSCPPTQLWEDWVGPCPLGAINVATHFERTPSAPLPAVALGAACDGEAHQPQGSAAGAAERASPLPQQPPSQGPPAAPPIGGQGSPGRSPKGQFVSSRAEGAKPNTKKMKAQLPRARLNRHSLGGGGGAAAVGGGAARKEASARRSTVSAKENGTAPAAAAGCERGKPERIGSRFVEAVSRARANPRAGWFQARRAHPNAHA